MSATSNHAKAPRCAAFVQAMRAEFGEVDVLYVNENGLLMGEKSSGGAPCTHRGDGSLFGEEDE